MSPIMPHTPDDDELGFVPAETLDNLASIAVAASPLLEALNALTGEDLKIAVMGVITMISKDLVASGIEKHRVAAMLRGIARDEL